MPEPDDFEKIDQIVEIARILSRIPTGNPAKPYMGTPAPIRASWATELYEDFGLRVHPDLAKKEMVRVQTQETLMGRACWGWPARCCSRRWPSV